jgi:hypothetical protein
MNRAQQPKTLVVLFGPPAVGKMAVGYELERLTGLRLFHNHMTIDLVLRFFEFGTPAFQRLVSEFRARLLEEVAESNLPGLVFTYVWALDLPEDKAFVDRLARIFETTGAHVHFVELEATQEERLRRNETELRLAEKRPKRDVGHSRQLLLDADQKHRLNSGGEFFYPERHVHFENTRLSAAETAELIVARLNLPKIGGAETGR